MQSVMRPCVIIRASAVHPHPHTRTLHTHIQTHRAEMLERMYMRWAEAMGFTTKTLDRSAGDVAGVKSVEIEISGEYA